MYLPVSFNEVNHCALCLFSLCLLSKWEDYPCLQNFTYSTMNPLELLSKIQFSLSKELNIKCMNKIVKKEVLVVCLSLQHVGKILFTLTFYRTEPVNSPLGGEGMQWSSEGEVLPPPPPNTLSLPNCSQQQLYNRPLRPVTKS